MEHSSSWHYLSPESFGWDLIPGLRGRIRRLLQLEIDTLLQSDHDPPATALTGLVITQRLLDAISVEMTLLVAEAHHRGVTWEHIAQALACSRQNAHSRFHKKVYSAAVNDTARQDLLLARKRIQSLALEPNIVKPSQISEFHRLFG